MYRKYLTEAQFERLKQEQRGMRYSDTRLVADVFPAIDKIEVSYHLYHGSAFGVQNEDHTRVITPQHQAVFVIECLNRECTSLGFDLKSVIWEMYRTRLTEKSATMKCDGQEAPDHPEQSCDGTLRFTIKIEYK